MQENFIHFLSENTCLLDINGKNIGTIDNVNNMEIDIITKCDKIYVTYNPIISHQNIPYSVLLDTQNNVKCENEYIEVVPFPNNQFDIIMKPFYYYQVNNSKILLNTMVGKFFISIVSDTATKIIVYDGSNVVFSTNTTSLKSARAEIKKEVLIIEGIVDDSNYYLLILDTKTFEVLHNDISNSIDKTSENIVSYKRLKDISCHAEVCKFEFEKKSKDIYHVYENNTPKFPLHPLLIPMAFIEAIKIKDDNLAKTFLHKDHINTPIEKFRDYFGEIKNIYLNRHDIKEDKINYTLLKKDGYNNYNFIMEENKIKDIEEIF